MLLLKKIKIYSIGIEYWDFIYIYMCKKKKWVSVFLDTCILMLLRLFLWVKMWVRVIVR